MSTMEQALRIVENVCEEIMSRTETPIRRAKEDYHLSEQCHQEGRWHGANDCLEEIRARLAALTAALPAPGVEAPGDWVMVPKALTDDMAIAWAGHPGDTMDGAYAAMLAAAPSAPAEISQAQAQAMREALRNLLMEAGYMAGQLAHRGLPGVPGDSVDRALNAARAALPPEPPR